jgi:asparagine synthase (glutamine-hydrolysing)
VFRYIAFVWDGWANTKSTSDDIVQMLTERLQGTSKQWSGALLRRGMHVFVSGARTGSSEVYALNSADCVLLGTVFERCDEQADGPLPRKSFSLSECKQILATGCRSLRAQCWGRYVAFAQDSVRHRSYIFRDPTGGLPCYRIVFRGVEIYCSSVADAAELKVLTLTVDWDYIAARVAFGYIDARETALREVTEVMAGEQLMIGVDKFERTFAWNPLDVAADRPIEVAEAAQQEMHRVTKVCVQSWQARYGSILHKLSGGLDSSIVLGCMKRGPGQPSLTCLTYYSWGSNEDEREWARLVAHAAHVRLLEMKRNGAARLEDMLTITRSAAPTFYLGPLQTSNVEARVAREIGATAYFSGAGGDQLFYQGQAVLACADYLRTHGLGRRFVEVALHAAQLERLSIWRIFAEAYRQRQPLSPSNFRSAFASMRTLTGDHLLAQTTARGGFTHPLFENIENFPPGKFSHASGLAIPTEFYDPLGSPDDPEQVHPLLSQPLIELCLRIPTYVLSNSGWDRAVARRAFRAEVPREVRNRRSKGGMDENAGEILSKNQKRARELLLNGHLVAAGLLDRGRVDQVLSEQPTRISSSVGEIFDHLSTEIWLRSWLNDR